MVTVTPPAVLVDFERPEPELELLDMLTEPPLRVVTVAVPPDRPRLRGSDDAAAVRPDANGPAIAVDLDGRRLGRGPRRKGGGEGGCGHGGAR